MQRSSTQKIMLTAGLIVLLGAFVFLGVTVVRQMTRPRSKVLFIGNSYTYGNDLPSLIAQLAEAASQPTRLDATMIAAGGATLRDNWQAEATRAALRQGGWDYVVLQEQSLLPIAKPAGMHRYVRLFDREIERQGGKTVLFLTWARQNAPATQRALNDAYERIAREVQAIVVPVGVAWQTARAAHPGIALYEADGSHPALAGSYLAACMFYATLYGASPAGIANTAGGDLPDSDAAVLQQIAWRTVMAYRGTRTNER